MDSCKHPAPLPPVGASAREAEAVSLLTSAQPLLGYVKLHTWLVFCKRTAPEAADPTVQVSASVHNIFMLQYSRQTHLKHVNVPELKFTHVHAHAPPSTDTPPPAEVKPSKLWCHLSHPLPYTGNWGKRWWGNYTSVHRQRDLSGWRKQSNQHCGHGCTTLQFFFFFKQHSHFYHR